MLDYVHTTIVLGRIYFKLAHFLKELSYITLVIVRPIY